MRTAVVQRIGIGRHINFLIRHSLSDGFPEMKSMREPRGSNVVRLRSAT